MRGSGQTRGGSLPGRTRVAEEKLERVHTDPQGSLEPGRVCNGREQPGVCVTEWDLSAGWLLGSTGVHSVNRKV